MAIQTSNNITSYENARKHGILKQPVYVVVLDDNKVGRTVISELIKQLERELVVIQFGDAISTLKWLKTHTPNLIITDFRMPEMSGIEFTQEVKKNANLASVPIVMVTAHNERHVKLDAIEAGVSAFLGRPIDKIECLMTCRNLLKMHDQQLVIKDRADWLTSQMVLTGNRMKAGEQEAFNSLVNVVKSRLPEFYDPFLMPTYVKGISAHLGLSEMELDGLGYASSLRDIGSIVVPDHILSSEMPLTDKDYESIKAHPLAGYNILSNNRSRYIQLAAVIALNHHERFDGSGYPNGISGESIPLAARLAAVADVYSALISIRPNRPAWSKLDALKYIVAGSGTMFDPRCVDALVSFIAAERGAVSVENVISIHRKV